jgi:hypothetical protein
VLRRIFGPKRHEMIGSNEELHNLYSLPSIIRMTKEDEITGRAALVWTKTNAYRFWLEIQKERDH